MSRYRVTERELLEQVRQEGRMKDIYTMAFDGDSAEAIAKKLKLDVATVKKVLGEMFTKKDFLDNEKDNEHSQNALELAKKYGTSQEITKMKQIIGFAKSRGFINKPMFDIQTAITRKYYPKLKEELELKEFNPDFGKDTKAGRTKETHADDKKTKDEDRIKSLENEIQRLKLELENEKNATVKPEPNPDTGEVPLTVGIAHKYLKDKQEKEKVKKEELEEATFSPAMLSQLKKAYGNLKTITPSNATKLNKILDKVNKDGLIDLYKAKIPFVSIGAGGKLSQKHNLSPKDINRIISKEEVELTEYFATVHLPRNISRSDKAELTDFIRKYSIRNKKDIDYVDDDAGGNIEFEGKGAHKLADKIKSEFGTRVTKESFEPIGEELEEDTNKYITEKIKGLENKAKKSGMPYSILKKVYDRGMAAWKGGHRPGATQQQWAFARVNSFVTKSSGTWGKADKDLADKVRASKKEEVELDELQNYSRQLKDPSKEMMVVDKSGKVSVIDKSEFEKYKRQGYMAAEDIGEDGPCWKTHKQVGMKKKNGRMVPNCVPKNEELKENLLIHTKDDRVTDQLVYHLRDLQGRGRSNISDIDTDNVYMHRQNKYVKGRINVEIDGSRSDSQKLIKDLQRKYGSKIKVSLDMGEVKKEELDKDDKPLVKKVADMLKKASKKHASQSKMLDKAVNEADLTDKQVKMVRKVADKLPKDDFKKRYGKDADNVKFGTATNIVKKKLKIDEYEGARTLVDRLLKQERGDE